MSGSDESPGWALGLDPAQLRELRMLFARQQPFAFGRSSLPREVEIARAIRARSCAWPEGRRAFAIVRRNPKPTRLAGFAGSFVRLPAGAALVTDSAWADRKAGEELFLSLRANAAKSRCMLAVRRFSEDEEAASILASVGLASDQVVQVDSATDLRTWSIPNDVGGLDRVGVADIDRATLRHVVKPSSESAFFPYEDLAEIEAELAAYGDRWARSPSWGCATFALRGFFGDPLRTEKPAEMPRAWKAEHETELGNRIAWTSAAGAFPKTIALLERRVRNGFERVLFVRTDPGAGIRRTAAADRQIGTADGDIARLHFPIRTSNDLVYKAWTLEGHELGLEPQRGGVFYLDRRKPHAALNSGSSPSVELVVDVVMDADLRRMIRFAWQ